MNGANLGTPRVVLVVSYEATFTVGLVALLQTDCLREFTCVYDDTPLAFDVSSQFRLGIKYLE